MNQDRNLPLSKIRVGDTLSRDVVSAQGQLLLSKNVTLTQDQLDRLELQGIYNIWIVQEATAVTPPSPMQKSYVETLATITNLFTEAKRTNKIDWKEAVASVQHLHTVCDQEPNLLRLMDSLWTQDAYTMQHSVGVGLLANRIAKWLGLSDEQCTEVLLGGTFHDIGKSLVDPVILNKPDKLTPVEYSEVKKHTKLGYSILKNSGVAEPIARMALHHHERMDGSGYPYGLKGGEIDIYSRICAVADVFHAMTTRRVYRREESYYKVLESLHQDSFASLDPNLISLFLNRMLNFFHGNKVKLSDGQLGEVVLVHPDMPFRPLLRLEAGFLDLRHRPDLYIEQVQEV
ncbi:HD-GYP domain-containing protein [Tumebacillus permanentifrigoris]|uniref:Putative nucleotidyltransferase with HDIG domain n=1 Tax=Tumebacillus permanentifrigoris TaxID=378543 RepID=A0A316D916_9BACL|nr:HD-GYP domain-containing protein [Tumebacillus permanentifrigoris]PWK13482.1 putative nucleotidyltransferase with HDIG domain [Tumebacillus permanentifrigoris]